MFHYQGAQMLKLGIRIPWPDLKSDLLTHASINSNNKSVDLMDMFSCMSSNALIYF